MRESTSHLFRKHLHPRACRISISLSREIDQKPLTRDQHHKLFFRSMMIKDEILWGKSAAQFMISFKFSWFFDNSILESTIYNLDRHWGFGLWDIFTDMKYGFNEFDEHLSILIYVLIANRCVPAQFVLIKKDNFTSQNFSNRLYSVIPFQV